MNWFPRVRATLRRRAWQYLYAQQVMRRTTYGFNDGIEQAKIAQQIYADTWMFQRAEDCADYRINLTTPREKMR